ncbi:DUF934 domain-containing protein [Motiliproteus sediminis]|uniref:DUF934 domain-containing protein n=1 Tax=Motiliproteus sediminis TaxID=1468178 RepID=UPI001AEFCFC4|nr:DUF934 domain-containing protein [Motiliproteus sediminis]
MPLIIDRQPAADTWVRVDSEEGLKQSGDLLVDFALWLEHADQLKARDGRLGVVIDGDSELDPLLSDLDRLALVAVAFPSFADGRGFSLARMLRQHHGFTGEIRAVGDVTWDRLRYMARCGINAYDVPAERYSDDMLSAFDEITVCYQGAEDDPRPIYRQS